MQKPITTVELCLLGIVLIILAVAFNLPATL